MDNQQNQSQQSDNPGQTQQPVDPYAGSAFGSMIPTKNKDALIGYYLGFGAIIPLLGVVFFIPAIIFGVRGLIFAGKHPEVKGKVHAWIGIVFGVLQGLGALFLAIALLTAN